MTTKCSVWLAWIWTREQLFSFTIKVIIGPSLVVQQLRLCASNAGGAGSIPGQGNNLIKKKSMKNDLAKLVELVGIQYMVLACTLSCVQLLQPHGLQRARLLCPRDFPRQYITPEWIAISFFRGSSRPRDGTCISCDSCIGRRILLPQSHLGHY